MSEIILEMKNIRKLFPGVIALNDVNLKVEKGEIHALVGENGAGKSTLMKVLSGVHPHGSYEGDILYNGEKCAFKDIKQSEEKGIVIIHQELALIPELSIAENIFLGNEICSKGIINWHKTIDETKKLLGKVKLDESPVTLVTDIGVGKQQLVEIAKALSKKVELLILDEPTSALNEEDSKNLLELLLEFKRQGITSILISHKLNEVSAVADSITILRDGSTIETLYGEAGEYSEDRIIKGMVGRDFSHRFPPRNAEIGDVLLEVKNWNVYHPMHDDRKVIKDVSFYIKKGEVVGIAGLMGAGRTELAMSIFGKSYGIRISGEIYKDGEQIEIHDVSDAIDHKIAYVTEDRKTYGLLLDEDIKRNIALGSLKNLSKANILNQNEEVLLAEEYRKKINIKCPGIQQKVVNLSGGNQQKVVLAKWIATHPDVLIMDDPTRGIDVGAKYEIYTIINKLAEEGKAILLISSELPEILGMSDRIYVMSEGCFTGELSGSEASQEKIMKLVINNSEV